MSKAIAAQILRLSSNPQNTSKVRHVVYLSNSSAPQGDIEVETGKSLEACGLDSLAYADSKY